VSFFTTEPRGDKCAHDVERKLNSNDARAENQHVAVVVFA
jgi:hypothetical protein